MTLSRLDDVVKDVVQQPPDGNPLSDQEDLPGRHPSLQSGSLRICEVDPVVVIAYQPALDGFQLRAQVQLKCNARKFATSHVTYNAGVSLGSVSKLRNYWKRHPLVTTPYSGQ